MVAASRTMRSASAAIAAAALMAGGAAAQENGNGTKSVSMCQDLTPIVVVRARAVIAARHARVGDLL